VALAQSLGISPAIVAGRIRHETRNFRLLSHFVGTGAVRQQLFDLEAARPSTSSARDRDGEIRKKRSDTLVDTLRREYGESFAQGYRSDAKLGTVLKREGVETLDQLLKKRG
jgi:hypothetical protein